MAEQPDVEQLLREIRKLRVSDVLVSSFHTIAQLGYAKLDPESRDLEQARVAVEGLKAIAGVLEGQVPPETTRDFNQVVANLQLAYAAAATAPASEAASEAAEEDSGAEPQSPEPAAEPAPEAASEPAEGDSGSEPQSQPSG